SRIGIFALMLVGMILAAAGMIAESSAQGYAYAGRLTGYAPDCGRSRVVGSVLDENGNHVTEPVLLRVWQEGSAIPYYQMSGTTPSELTGPSGFNLNLQQGGYWGYAHWIHGTFNITVVETKYANPYFRNDKMDEGWLAEPVKFTTEYTCDSA